MCARAVTRPNSVSASPLGRSIPRAAQRATPTHVAPRSRPSRCSRSTSVRSAPRGRRIHMFTILHREPLPPTRLLPVACAPCASLSRLCRSYPSRSRPTTTARRPHFLEHAPTFHLLHAPCPLPPGHISSPILLYFGRSAAPRRLLAPRALAQPRPKECSPRMTALSLIRALFSPYNARVRLVSASHTHTALCLSRARDWAG